MRKYEALVAVMVLSGCIATSDPIKFVLVRHNETPEDLWGDLRTASGPNRHELPAGYGGHLVMGCTDQYGDQEQFLNATIYRASGPAGSVLTRVAGPQIWHDLRCPAEYNFTIHRDFTMSLTLIRAAKDA